MAEIVAGYAVPYTQGLVAEVQLKGERSETAQFFLKMRSHLEGSNPALILTVSNDQIGQAVVNARSLISDHDRKLPCGQPIDIVLDQEH
jgi:hypothetical protein